MRLNQPHYVDPRREDAQLSLDGVWRFGYADAPADYPGDVELPYTASLPASLFWNLSEAGVLPPPYQGLNSREYDWVDEKVWYFRKNFPAPASAAGRTAILCMDGAAYYTRVWLNGTLLGEHEGMFGGPVVNVSGQLLWDAPNTLLVEIKAADYGQKENFYRHIRSGGSREIIPWNIARDNDTSNGIWQVLGLWRGVRLMLLSPYHLARPYLTTGAVDGNGARLRLETEIIGPDYNELHHFYGIREEEERFPYRYGVDGMREAALNLPATLYVCMREKDTGREVYAREYPVPLLDRKRSLRGSEYPEAQLFEAEWTLPEPRLWWPFDMGNPALYTVALTLKVNGEACDTLTLDTGIRTLERVRTPGPRAAQQWDDFQLVVNSEKLFVKGVNMQPLDVLYREDTEELRWTLELVRQAGIHLVRIWSGGGKPESDSFYQLCDEMGIMVWQDHLIANSIHTENWPQEVLESQEAMNIFRLRNHPSLVIHCGGNEFDAYAPGNAASMFIIDRNVRMLDPARPFVYTTPLKGSAHIYRDMEPTWYRSLFRDLPFVAETGIHSLPSLKAMRGCLSARECGQKVPDMVSEAFAKAFPELLNHFAEYVPSRVPRMLARAGQIADLSDVTLKEMTEATQMAAYEYYEILIQALRENYPVTCGVMPWVFRRTWPTVGIQLVDGSGEPLLPYYAVKKAYQPVEAHIAWEHISFAPGETALLPVRVLNERHHSLEGLAVRVRVYDPSLRCLTDVVLPAAGADGACIRVPVDAKWAERFFFATVDLMEGERVLNRQAYWPKCLQRLADEAERARVRAQPAENFRMPAGPWLKPQIASAKGAVLEAEIKGSRRDGRRASFEVTVRNRGKLPAFPVILTLEEVGVRCLAGDNAFWLDAGEERSLELVADAPGGVPETVTLSLNAWNAAGVALKG